MKLEFWPPSLWTILSATKRLSSKDKIYGNTILIKVLSWNLLTVEICTRKSLITRKRKLDSNKLKYGMFSFKFVEG